MRHSFLSLLATAAIVFSAGCSGSESATATSQDALQQLVIEDASLPEAVSRTVSELNASCTECGLTVAAYDVRSEGPIDMESAKELLGPELSYFELEWVDRGAVDRVHLQREFERKTLLALLPALETELNKGGTVYPANHFDGQRMTAPDYCTGEQRYVVVFEETRTIITIGFNDSHEC